MLERPAGVFKALPIVVVGAMLLLVAPLLFPDWFTAEPLGKHAWAQADHLSIAQKFGEQPTFFTPHSHNLRPDFMGEERTDLTTGITRADFPVPHYVAGLLMRWTGGGTPLARWVFYLFGVSGVLALALLWMKEGHRRWWVVPLIIGAFASPLWLFFSTAMMPSSVALSALCWALLGWFRYRDFDDLRGLLVTVVCLALAALFRPPYAVFGLGFGWWMLEEKRLLRKRELGVVLAALLLCVGYTAHSLGLGHQHGSLFLSGFDWGMSPGEQLATGWSGLRDHFPVVSGLAVAGFLAVVVGLGRRSIPGKLLRPGILVLALSLTYQYLVAPQFVHHDYYLLDTWVPLLLVALTALMPVWKKHTGIVVSILFAGAAFGWVQNGWAYSRKPDLAYPQGRALAAFAASEGLLAQANVPVQARVLVLDAFSTNQALLFQGHSGYFVPATDSSQLAWALEYPFDVVLVPRESMEAEWVRQHGLDRAWTCLASNGLCNVYRPRAASEPVQERADWLGDSLWEKYCWSVTLEDVDGTEEFPKGDGLRGQSCTPSGPIQMRIQANVREASDQALIVMRTAEGYTQFPVPVQEDWQHEVTLPCTGGPYQVYFWNRGSQPLKVDSIHVDFCWPK